MMPGTPESELQIMREQLACLEASLPRVFNRFQLRVKQLASLVDAVDLAREANLLRASYDTAAELSTRVSKITDICNAMEQ